MPNINSISSSIQTLAASPIRSLASLSQTFLNTLGRAAKVALVIFAAVAAAPVAHSQAMPDLLQLADQVRALPQLADQLALHDNYHNHAIIITQELKENRCAENPSTPICKELLEDKQNLLAKIKKASDAAIKIEAIYGKMENLIDQAMQAMGLKRAKLVHNPAA